MSKKIKKKKKVIPVGTNVHSFLDNVITLYRSSNDTFTGALDYIFFKVLNCDPEQYYNLTDSEEISKDEIKEMQEEYENYEKKHCKEVSKTLERELNEVILYIREKALKENVIKEFSNDKYEEINYSYTFEYLLKKLMDFYKEKV